MQVDKDNEKPDNEPDVDRGFAWIILTGSFFMYMFIVGTLKSYGVLYTEMLEHFSSGSGNTAWIGSMALLFTLSLGLVLFVALTTECVISISVDDKTQDTLSKPLTSMTIIKPMLHIVARQHKVKRAASSDPRRNCNTWAPWVNENHPSLANKTDKEFIPPKTRNAFCPSTVGGNISRFECKDERGEGFHTNKTVSGGFFFISCYDINVGVECFVLNATKDHCPDMSLRYFCYCPNATSVPVNTTATLAGIENTTFTTIGTEKKTGVPLLWLILVPLLAGLLFLFNSFLAVCLYKQSMKTMREKDKKTAVHPL